MHYKFDDQLDRGKTESLKVERDAFKKCVKRMRSVRAGWNQEN